MAWLKEMEVVDAVRSYLETRGFEVVHVVKNTSERGTDIVATSPTKNTVKIEAKGQTRSDTHSKRFGKEFNTNQKEDNLGRALLTCLTYIDEGFFGGVALPSDD